jgi:multidrug resistance efflux pump
LSPTGAPPTELDGRHEPVVRPPLGPRPADAFRADAPQASEEPAESPLLALTAPWTWAGLAGAALFLLGSLAALFFFEVEVTGRARAIVRPASGVHTLVSRVGGTVTQVLVRPGDDVEAGAEILRLESAVLQAQLLEADRELQLLRSGFRAFAEGEARGLDDQRTLVQGRVSNLSDQVQSQIQSVQAAEHRLSIYSELRQLGLVSDVAAFEAHEAVAQARRQLSALESQLKQTRQELAALASRDRALSWEGEKDLRSAQSRRDALAYSLEDSVVRAPRRGRVEAVLLKPGDVALAGQVAGKVVPLGQELQVAGFVPERDRAFVRAGDAVRLEIDQLPYLEFGTVEGEILRVAGEVVSAQELREALGDDAHLTEPAYRVEVRITPASVEKLGVPLRSGMIGSLRYVVRRRRAISMFLGTASGRSR